MTDWKALVAQQRRITQANRRTEQFRGWPAKYRPTPPKPATPTR